MIVIVDKYKIVGLDLKNVKGVTHYFISLFLVLQIKRLKDQVESNDSFIDALKMKRTEERDRLRDSRRSGRILPTDSDVYCFGNSTSDRTCRIRNLCMNTRTEKFFTLNGASSLKINHPLDQSAMLDLTTLDNHNVFFWSYQEVSSDFFTRKMDQLNVYLMDTNDRTGRLERRAVMKGLGGGRGGKTATTAATTAKTNLTIVTERTYLTKRFFPVNIMHVFHDDWLGMYTLRDIWPSLVDPYDEYYYDVLFNSTTPISTLLTTFEHHQRLEYDAAYEWLGRFHRIEDHLGWDTWPAKPAPEAYICFRDAVVGNSKQLAWYQYGYFEPQGPIHNSTATGWKLREAALHALRQMRLPPWDHLQQTATLHSLLKKDKVVHERGQCIAIFSRLSTRLILNEAELASHLEKEFHLPICWIRLEELKMPQIIAKLKRAVMAFGMHGSLLILCMFLPPGAVLVEGYPYGVPPENYTPYRTMAGLKGMRLAYRSWVAKDPKDSIGHPERGSRQGGIKHLNATYRQSILESTTIPPHLCCDHPHWLYRIFQDTKVDGKEVAALMWEGIRESYGELPKEWKAKLLEQDNERGL